MKKVTIKDVALHTGLSVSTISRVFNNYGDISDKTIKKVNLAAKELGYTPNSAAKQLSSKKKKIIALILNEINVTPGVAMPLEVLGGVVDNLDKTDYEFVFYATNSTKQKQKSLKQFCNERDITGLIIQGLRISDPYYQELATFDLPTVAIDLDIENDKVGTVSTDNVKAAFEMTRLLIELGHKNIIFINGTKVATVAQERESGYLAATDNSQIFYANFSENEAYQWAIDYAKNKGFKKEDAVFAASDIMAIGIIKAFRKLNLVNKVAVAGFDDITLASYITPSLTTVRQDIKKITEYAVKDLICQIESGEIKHRFVPFQIIERESTNMNMNMNMS
ncbi:LacI family transcriptional regulator [Lactococcus lactis]|uniref:LacI family DNA-binding transcriptional regulator n=1 Tax=Lactococcus lactis TaxID=1358 RepID=UPI00223AB0CD|nr:LacI family DNA-binding transcriptional regulator [Lactococcus lactis]MCT1193745.1 LacI family transcriptional regulator [Lactococcus lactis]